MRELYFPKFDEQKDNDQIEYNTLHETIRGLLKWNNVSVKNILKVIHTVMILGGTRVDPWIRRTSELNGISIK